MGSKGSTLRNLLQLEEAESGILAVCFQVMLLLYCYFHACGVALQMIFIQFQVNLNQEGK